MSQFSRFKIILKNENNVKNGLTNCVKQKFDKQTFFDKTVNVDATMTEVKNVSQSRYIASKIQMCST